MIKTVAAFFLLFLSIATAAGSPSFVHHELKVNLDPENRSLEVEDMITVPESQLRNEIHFMLHTNLDPVSNTRGVIIKGAKDMGTSVGFKNESEEMPFRYYSVQLPQNHQGDFTLSLSYSGTIHHSIKQLSEEYERSFSVTRGIISQEGVYLGGSAMWAPSFHDTLVTFNITVSLPESWDVISQGNRTMHMQKNNKRYVRWESPNPVDEIYLIGGKFTEYIQPAGTVTTMVFLRKPDDTLANKYLETTAQYLEMYQKLIGPYPYKKFALIENFWETGYGMPSFTLLGPRVIRFPFILHSSYPHEILHNWWGNGVFVDYEGGNWCEGLTAYLADHLIKEQRGQGVEYRRSALQKYTDYVKKSSDFSLKSFRSRHNASTEAIGYGKSLMMFHMLRQETGDDLFVKGLQAFYQKNTFKKATFDNIRITFEEVTGKDFKWFFEQWSTRTGAPELELSEVMVKPEDTMFELSFTLTQTQKGPPYKLNIPVAFHLDEEQKAMVKKLEMKQLTQKYTLSVPSNPLRIDVDPQCDVFRKLHRSETPPAFSQAFGAEKVLIVLPSKEQKGLREGYRQLANTWKKDVCFDNDLKEIPNDRAVWLFGWDNAHRKNIVESLKNYHASIDHDSVSIHKITLPKQDNSFVIAVRNPDNPDGVVVWLTADDADALPGLGRKLPHYGKYSYLAFEGTEPTNTEKGQWQVVGSPLRVNVYKDEGSQPTVIEGELPARNALANLPPVFSGRRMLEDISYLASKELQGRGFGSQGLDMAADYIRKQLKAAGLQILTQQWEESGGEGNHTANLKNVIGIIPGNRTDWEGQSVVICAHYDHLGLGWPDAHKGNEGKIHPGADDNASGVAVLLELARVLGTITPGRTIIFAAFTGEESGLRGSRYYMEQMKKYPADKIMGAINLDTVGRLGEKKLLVIGSGSAHEWRHICMGVGFVTGVDAELVTQDLDTSDQANFIDNGIPAIQLFTGPHADYHRPGDTTEKIDVDGLVKVATFTREATLYLVERENPMTFTGKDAVGSKVPHQKTGRKVSTGIMPDFSFSGNGVRITEISSDSPAIKAGLQKGDIIIRVDTIHAENLKAYSDALKRYAPGDTVTISFLREGRESKTSLTFVEH